MTMASSHTQTQTHVVASQLLVFASHHTTLVDDDPRIAGFYCASHISSESHAPNRDCSARKQRNARRPQTETTDPFYN